MTADPAVRWRYPELGAGQRLLRAAGIGAAYPLMAACLAYVSGSGVPFLAILTGLATWGFLRLLKVRPAWPVALLGPVVAVATLWVAFTLPMLPRLLAAGVGAILVLVLVLSAAGHGLVALIWAREPAWRRRLPFIAGTVALWLAAVGCAFWLAGDRLDEHEQRARAALRMIAAARSAKEPAADLTLTAQVEELRRAGLATTPIASSKVDVCEITSQGGGWMASSYEQRCELRYVEGYATDLDLNVIYERLKVVPSNQRDKCQRFSGSLPYDRIMVRSANSPISPYDCEMPTPTGALPSQMEQSQRGKHFRTYDPVAVDNTRNQVWLIVEVDYYREKLGCAPDGFIFCTSPRETPLRAP